MNISHVIRDLSPATGGPVSAVLGMAQAQAAAGHSVRIIATDFGVVAAPVVEGVEICLFPCHYDLWRWSSGMAAALPRLLGDADVVHIHTIWEHPSLAAAKVCVRLGKPYIVRPCGMLDRWSLAQSRLKKKLFLSLFGGFLLKNAAAIHVTSPGEKENSNFLGFELKVAIIPLGLPQAAFEASSPELFRQRFPQTADEKIILFLGRLHYKKQPDVAIRAFHAACSGLSGYCLVLAGGGDSEYLSRLHGIVQELGEDSRVHFVGMLGRDEVREAFSASEIFLLPSLQENFGIAVLEAMAAGCPVIVSDRVDLSPEINAAKAGVVCAPDVDSTTQALADLLADEAGRRQMGTSGRRVALENFSWEHVERQLDRFYGEVISAVQRK